MRENSLDRWLFLRLAMVTLVLTAGVILLELSADDVPRRALYMCLLAGYLVGAVGFLAVKAGLPVRLVQSAELVLDVLIVSCCVHLTGGVGSRFALLYFFPILLAAFQLKRNGALVISSFAALTFIAYSFATAYGWIRPVQLTFRVGSIPSDTLVQGYLVIALLLIVGYLSSELADRVERKEEELSERSEELLKARKETQSIVLNMSSGVLTLDERGVVQRVNPAATRILGCTEEMLIGKEVADVLGATMPMLAGHLLDALADFRPVDRVEINVARADGSVVPLGLSVSEQRGLDGETLGVIAVFQDLTAVVRMRERIRANDRLAAMGELSASIAHEIRNPLASIRGSVEMLSSELPLDGENARLMELVLKESERLNRILEDFLAYARLKPIARRNCHLGDVIDDFVDLVRHRAGWDEQLNVEIAPLPCDVVLSLDEELMKQVFLNLAINSAEAMHGQGTLTIAVDFAREADQVLAKLRFRDEGGGVDEEILDRLFEPFFTTKPHGTGLGLPLASRIVTNHDGRLEVANVEGGAEFVMSLPVVGLWIEGRLEQSRKALDEIVNFTQGVTAT